jgi:hypothetical protein
MNPDETTPAPASPAPSQTTTDVPPPTQATEPAAPVTPPAEEQISEEEKLERARLAMEGPERAARREAEEKHKALETEKIDLEQRLAGVTKEKEQLELAWVDLDDKRGDMKKILQPILDEEAEIEAEETKAEEEEKKMGLEREKQIIEKKKWLIEDKRRKVEQEKWNVEEKVWKLEEAIDANTKRYRELLDQEEEITTRLEKLKKEVL